MKEKHTDDLLESIHESAQSLFRMGVIDAAEMREFDEDCLVHEPEVQKTARKAQSCGAKAAVPSPAPNGVFA